ncbi:MAG: type IV toxin-antitoxin system AbiEi family antitoxin domain-containing protein [Caldisericia bacterium]|nr:type IV toxin-antitoxin system AbiEi family antitoxin domain-containing protein [Caldisericia bacterium]
MLSIETIQDKFKQHNGVMRTQELYEARIYYNDIQKLIENGVIEKIRYGYYQWIDNENFSEAITVTRLFPDAIMCMDTALFYYRYSYRTPLAWHLAVSKDSNKTRFKIDYPFTKPYYLEPSILELGAVDGEMDGNPIRIYNKERTICDCLRYMGKMDKEIFNKAIQSYIADSVRNIPRLSEYAKKLRVMQKVKMILGVWM